MKRGVESETAQNYSKVFRVESRWSDYFPPKDVVPDPSVYDLCVPAPLQWWYGNAFLTVDGDNKERFAFFASFFRQCESIIPSSSSKFFNACTWSLVDLVDKSYYPDSLLDPHCLEEIRKRIDPEVTGRPTEHVEQSLLELVKNGRLPRPDRAMCTPASYSDEPFTINLDGDCKLFIENKGGKRFYTFDVHNPKKKTSACITMETDQPPVLHGKDGVVNKMFYYYYPSMTVSGHIVINGVQRRVTGQGWFDREFGGDASEAGRDALDSWSWLSLRFSNSSQLSIFHVRDYHGDETKELVAVFTDGTGARQYCPDVEIGIVRNWTSLVTFMKYPAEYELAVPSLNLKATVRPYFAAQEFVTVLVKGGGFYEGAVCGSGTISGIAVDVWGFLEHKNPTPYRDTSELLKCVSAYVTSTLKEMYPLHTTDSWIRMNVLGRHATGSGTPPEKLCEVLFKPVRSIIDRGGKSWRSLILVSCCNAIATQYFDCKQYIAMAELLHVGSLIIDDIQDNSVVRRGGKCVHLEYGVATAINAGTACYFMVPQLARIHELPPEKSSRIYALYFDALRAGHAGQGLDIEGLQYLMPQTVESGDSRKLLEALDAIHTYKTGGAAGTICAMACILCDATPSMTTVLEAFGVSLGLAFQIVDDALNIKGFEGNLKEEAEDIRSGKVTYPIAVAIGKLDYLDRKDMWTILSGCPQELSDIQRVVQLVNETDAVHDCLSRARRLIEASWSTLDAVLEDSLPKIMMQTFCKFLVERTY